jgi:cullin 3
MVLHKNGEMLYNGVCALVAENLAKLARDEVVPAFPTGGSDDRMQQTQEREMLLKALRRIWDDHAGSMSKLRDILKYMVWFYSIVLSV